MLSHGGSQAACLVIIAKGLPCSVATSAGELIGDVFADRFFALVTADYLVIQSITVAVGAPDSGA